MMTVVNSLLPIFLVIALGAVLRATRFLSQEFFTGMNKLCYWVALPALLFYKVAGARFEGGAALSIFWVLLIATATLTLVGYVFSFVLRLPGPSRGAFVQASFRGNLVYVGLPVILYTLTRDGADAGPIESSAIVGIAPLVPIYNALAVLVLTLHGSGGKRPGVGVILKQIATNPLILSCLAGLAFCLGGIPLPAAGVSALKMTGQVALPLALLAIGSSLSFDRVRGNLLAASCAAFVKIAVAPLVGYAVARWLGVGPTETCIALVYLACPTAIISCVLAEQLGADHVLSGSAVVVSTLASMVSLAVIVYSFA